MSDKINANFNAVNNGLQSRYQTMNYANMVGMDPDTMGLDSGLLNFGGNYGCGGLDSLSFGGMMGGMMPYGGMYGGDPKKYMDYQKQYFMGNMQLQTELEDYQLNRQVERTHKSEGNQFNLEAANNVVDEKLEILNGQIQHNNQDYVKSDHKSAVHALKEKLIETKQVPADISDEQVSAYLNTLYEQKYHKSLGDSLIEKGDSQFVYGIKQGLDPLGLFTNKTSARQNMADILNYKLSPQEKSDKTAGQAVGYLGLGVATVGALLALPFALKGGFKGGGGLLKTSFKAWGNLFKSAPKVAT